MVRARSRYTAARFVIVLDRAGVAEAKLWEQAQTASVAGDPLTARRTLDKLSRLGGGEVQWAADAGLAALNAGRLERVTLVGLERLDIVDYLPVSEFVPNVESWQELRAQHRRQGAGKPFKTWLKEDLGASITTSRVRAAACNLDDLGDLPRLVDALWTPQRTECARASVGLDAVARPQWQHPPGGCNP